MPRIIGVDIPANKRIDIALRYVYGIGPKIATEIVEKTGIDPPPAPRTWTRTSCPRSCTSFRRATT